MSMHRFSYSPLTAGSHLVGLAGDFSDWQILPMEDMGGVFLLNLDIPEGRYAYKLIVDGNWMIDEACPLYEPDNLGGQHSILIIEASSQPFTWQDVLTHKAHKKTETFLKLYRSSETKGELHFKWYPKLADEVYFVTPDSKTILQTLGRSTLYDVFHIFLNTPPEHNLLFHLEIKHQEQLYYLGRAGLSANKADVQPIELVLADCEIFAIPAWLKESVVYQIFPDRFCNGNPAINPDFSEWYYKESRTPPPAGEYLPVNKEYFHLVEDWKDISGLQQSPYLPEGMPDWWSFYGGDIAGVASKLNYLKELGISVIYFNPLWQGKSNHKYDSSDYSSIDPHFGTPEEMREFVQLAHSMGLRMILDVAFNHTGETFWAFRDCVEKGAESPYWNWYDWHQWPLPSPLPPDFKPKDYYQCWWGIKDMPDLNYDLSRPHPDENAIRDIKEAVPNQSLVDYVLASVRWWLLELDIDGFRLDVPDEVPFWFWELFRKEIKTFKPDAWIVGEIWNDAVQWVNARYFDSVMNYAFFKNPVTEFFIHKLITKREFSSVIERGLTLHPFHALQAMMNLLGGHDTYRIFELAKGNVSAVKQAIVFQMTFIGMPHIYYGDEIAMLGGKDPDNRRPFDWDWQHKELSSNIHQLYTELIQLRKANKVFTEGSFAFLPSTDNLLVYSRSLNDSTAIVYHNIVEVACEINVPAGMKVVFGSCELSKPVLAAHTSLIVIQ